MPLLLAQNLQSEAPLLATTGDTSTNNCAEAIAMMWAHRIAPRLCSTWVVPTITIWSDSGRAAALAGATSAGKGHLCFGVAVAAACRLWRDATPCSLG